MKLALLKKQLPVALAFCCLVWAFFLPPANASAADKFKPFKLKTLDGEKKTLQDFNNKATLVGFYYPTCAYCNKALPEILKIYEKYKDRGLSFAIINVKPEEDKLIETWKGKYHVSVPVLVGASLDSLMDTYNLTMTPTHYLLGKKGEVLLHQSGYNGGDEKTIEGKVVEALATGPETTTPKK